MSTFLSRRTLAALVAVLLVLSFIPTSDGPLLEVLVSSTGLDAVNGSAQDHLKEQREQALKGFLLLSALKVGLAVLRSSEIGFVLNIRIGDLAVAVYDYVNFGWKVLLAAVTYYYMAEYLLALVSVVNVWFLWLALVCVAAWLLVVDLRPRSDRLRSLLGQSAFTACVVAALLYIVLPLSFVGADWVSKRITGDPIREANMIYDDMGKSMPSLSGDGASQAGPGGGSNIGTSSVTVPFPYDGIDPALALTESPDGEARRSGILKSLVSGEKLRELGDYLETRSRSLASAVLRQTAAYLFNIVLFPILMLAGVYFSIKYLMSLTLAR